MSAKPEVTAPRVKWRPQVDARLVDWRALAFGFWLIVHAAPFGRASPPHRGLVRIYESNHNREPGPRTAREILDERFSKGEIDREDYEMRRKALSG